MKVIEGEFTENAVDEIPLLPKLKLYAYNHSNVHLICDIFTTQQCTCRYEDGSLIPERWPDELILAGLKQQLSPYFTPNLRPYAQFTFSKTFGIVEYLGDLDDA